MKKSLFSRAVAFAVMAITVIGTGIAKAFEPYGPLAVQPNGVPTSGLRLRQGGFVLLGGARGYAGYAAGTIVELPASTEAALIASGQATLSAGPPTAGPVSTTANSGCVTVAAAAASIVVTHPGVTVQSQIAATVAQAAADGTFLRVERIVPANGSFTIYGTAAATAATLVKWAIINPNGSFTAPI